MKKFYSLLAAAFCATASFGVNAQSYVNFTTEEMIRVFGGLMPFGISPNGQFVSGATIILDAFIYDFENDKFVEFDSDKTGWDEQGQFILGGINNQGVAYGNNEYGIARCDIQGNSEILFEKPHSVYQLYCDGNTLDGSILVGCSADESWEVFPCYWENGEQHWLPLPTEEEVGFEVFGGRAKFISNDGSVIAGFIRNNFSDDPLILWFRQADGTYKMDPRCVGKFEPDQTYIYGEYGEIIGTSNGPNPYLFFKPGALSGDGKKLAMYIKRNTEEIYNPIELGIYDIESDTLELIEDTENIFEEFGNGEFILEGISNEGTVVGTAGSMWLGAFPFIMDGKEKVPMLLADAYPQFEELTEFVDEAMFGWPAFGTGITPDGRYIIGYGTKEQYQTAGLAFRIDRENGASIKTIGQSMQDGEEVIYDLQGRRMNSRENLSKGIYIINGKKVAISK